jgi:ABC-type iron transport system FetAB permease component
MDTLAELSGLAISIIGWAATVLIILGITSLTENDRRALIVSSWLIWGSFGFGTLVLHGLLTIDGAALYTAVTIAVLASVVLASALLARRPKS